MEGKKKKQDSKNRKKIKKYLGENFQRDIQQNCSMGKAIRNTIESIERKWEKIGDNRKGIHSLDIAEICS